VAEVTAGSAAAEAGLAPGDVVASVNDHAIRNAQDFYNAEGQLVLGESLQMEYAREGKFHHAKLVIRPVPELKGGELDQRFTGARFSELNARLKQKDYIGVILDQLDPRSRLAREGMLEGDIITGVNRQPVRNLRDFRKTLHAVRGTILLQIRRDRRTYIARID